MEMSFQFSSLSEFLYMNGHGVFVWSCYLITLLAFCWLGLSPLFKRRTFFRIQRAIFSRQRS